MSLTNPTNIAIIALLGLAAITFVIASLTGGGKWRRLYDEEREEYASYAEGADTDLRVARQRIGELERNLGTLQRQHADALASIATLKAAATETAAPAPTPAVPVANVVPLAIVPAASVVEAEAVTEAEVSAPVVHLPIAPESVIDHAEARPIASVDAALSELPPAPIGGVTPLRAPEPVPELRVEPTPAEVIDALPAPAVEAAEEVGDVTPPPPVVEEAVFTDVHEAPAAPAPVAVVEDTSPAPVEIVAATTQTPAIPLAAPSAPIAEAEPAKSWFGSGRRDNLTRLSGVDPLVSNRLFALGVTTYDDIVQLSQEDEIALEQRLGVPAGYITREQWRTQASLLRFGKEDEFNERFGKLDA